MEIRTAFPVLIILLILIGCSNDAARVGSTGISDRDIELRSKVSEIYFPGSGKPSVGLAQLIKGAVAAEVLRSKGFRMDDDSLDREIKRIDEQTKAPELLQKVKEVYQQNMPAYRRTFIQPAYAERILYREVFLMAPEIQTERKQTATVFLSAVTSNPDSFESAGRDLGISVVILNVSADSGIVPAGKESSKPPVDAMGKKVGRELLARIASHKDVKGPILPEVIEWPDGYQVVKVIKRGKSTAVIQSAAIPKKSFDEWLWEQAKDIRVKIRDRALRDQFVKEVSWARNLNLQ
ncbi:MAG: hypothetical protein M0042_06870 [Nitrospiraceae bacterium]|nr:hypothetical protein [Nitrospiraceae bacterium]